MQQLSIKDIETLLQSKKHLTSDERAWLESDQRKGVRTLLTRWDRQQAAYNEACRRFHHMMTFERDLSAKGCRAIAGIDEVGRGPLAGPVVSAAVILKPDATLIGVNDSKKLTRKQRRELVQDIKREAVAIGVGHATAREIDAVNIYQATKLAMQRAVDQLDVAPDHLLIDAMTLELDIPQTSLIKGDARSASIAAASIIAKETRDAIMEELDSRYPGYDFGGHMGYGTKTHLEAVGRLGPCPEHRLSFSPFRTG